MDNLTHPERVKVRMVPAMRTAADRIKVWAQ
jgi:hypothetical protein